MNNKRVYILAGIALFLVVGAIAVFLFAGEKKTQPPANNTTPINNFPINTTPSVKPQSSISSQKPSNPDNIVVEGEKGKVEIKDPSKIKKNEVTPQDFVLEENPQFAIFYLNYEDGPNFLISITDPEIEAARKAAEAKFLELLSVSKDDACKLRVSLTVPMSISEEASGPDYHLSFCPDGKPFPKQ